MINLIVRLQLLLSVLFFQITNSSCQNKEKQIRSKIDCYNDYYRQISKTNDYKSLITAFRKSFSTLSNDKRIFGDSSFFDISIDSFVYFNKQKSEALLFVRQKPKTNELFGSVRVVRAWKKTSEWLFKASVKFIFEKDYFDIYPSNSISKISDLGKFHILTAGESQSQNCKLDQKYWFQTLKE
jgi:hypothetical protein